LKTLPSVNSGRALVLHPIARAAASDAEIT